MLQTISHQPTTKMTPIVTDQEPKSQSSVLILDCLYCEEKCWDDENDDQVQGNDVKTSTLSSQYYYSSLEDDEDEVVSLLSKEVKTHFSEGVLDYSKSLMEDRREVVDWMMRVNAYHSFCANTLVLGVNYFDRFMMSFGYKKDRPWSTQLAAVACLSLASKWEETHVPLLLDFQVESKYIFEPKTIQRMELLILSTLDWKMNAVTPFSFFEHLIKRLKLKAYLPWEMLSRCQSLILSAIVDPRFLCYFPSVLAAATMVLTLKELGLWSTLEHQIYLLDTFKLSKDKVEECYKFIQELSSNNSGQKRKCVNSASSPKNVLDVAFCESSKDSFISSLQSPEPLPKRSRTIGSHYFG